MNISVDFTGKSGEKIKLRYDENMFFESSKDCADDTLRDTVEESNCCLSRKKELYLTEYENTLSPSDSLAVYDLYTNIWKSRKRVAMKLLTSRCALVES